jgi:hypothetical protein
MFLDVNDAIGLGSYADIFQSWRKPLTAPPP